MSFATCFNFDQSNFWFSDNRLNVCELKSRNQRGKITFGESENPPWNFGKNVVVGFMNGTGLILHSIYVEYNPDQMWGWCRLELKSVFS